jgi:hypothetical protein
VWSVNTTGSGQDRATLRKRAREKDDDVLDLVAVESEAIRTKSLPVIPNEHSVDIQTSRPALGVSLLGL